MGYPRAGMIDFLKLLGGSLVGLFRSHAAREAEMAFSDQRESCLINAARQATTAAYPRTIATCNLASSDFASVRESPTSSAVAANIGRVMLTNSSVSTS